MNIFKTYARLISTLKIGLAKIDFSKMLIFSDGHF